MTTETNCVVDLNVGGLLYTTSIDTLTKDEGSLLTSWFRGDLNLLSRDSKGRVFIDRDGVLFRYILDYLRNGNLILPENFQELDRLRLESQYFKLDELSQQLEANKDLLSPHKKRPSATDMSGIEGTEGYITVGYRGTFAIGRGDMSTTGFRKLTRILVCGKSALCREVFKDTLNESRDPDRGLDGDRYTSRYFLKHTILEQAFDHLCAAGFKLVASCASGTSAAANSQDMKPGQVTEEEPWNHYNEFVFLRKSECSCTCSPSAVSKAIFSNTGGQEYF